jgi:hypothetical protein
MGALINVGGFESLGIVGDHEGAIFDSYAHMSHVIIENKDQIKKTSKKDPKRGMTEFYRILRESTGEIEGWTRREVAERSIEHFGYLDVGQLVDPSILEVFESKEIAPVDQYEDQGIYWFAAMKVEPKMTKTGKGYLLIHAQGPTGRTVRLNCWGWDGKRKIEPYAICFAEMKHNDYGISTDMKKLRELA